MFFETAVEMYATQKSQILELAPSDLPDITDYERVPAQDKLTFQETYELRNLDIPPFVKFSVSNKKSSDYGKTIGVMLDLDGKIDLSDRVTDEEATSDLETISLAQLAAYPAKYYDQAIKDDAIQIRGNDGTTAVLVSHSEWTMLQQALKLCMEHPEWTMEN